MREERGLRGEASGKKETRVVASKEKREDHESKRGGCTKRGPCYSTTVVFMDGTQSCYRTLLLIIKTTIPNTSPAEE